MTTDGMKQAVLVFAEPDDPIEKGTVCVPFSESILDWMSIDELVEQAERLL